MSEVSGVITNVWTENAGSELAVAYSGGATLAVVDSYDFNESGGTLTLGGVSATYTGVDHDTDILTGFSGGINSAVGTEVLVVPLAHQMWAMVDHEDGEEGTRALVPMGMRSHLQTGIRDEASQETCTISDVSGRWQVSEVANEIVIITATEFRTSDDLVSGNGVSGMRIATDDIGGIIQFFSGDLTETNPGYINPRAVSGGLPMIEIAGPKLSGISRPIIQITETGIFITPRTGSTFFDSGGIWSTGGVYTEGVLGAGGAITGDGDVRATVDLWAIGISDTSNGANVYVGAGGKLWHSTSRSDAKLDQADIPFGDCMKLLNVKPKTWIDKGQADEREGDIKGLPRIPGLIAEDVQAQVPYLIDLDDEGGIRGIHSDRVAAMLIPIIKRQQERIDDLEARLSRLEGA